MSVTRATGAALVPRCLRFGAPAARARRSVLWRPGLHASRPHHPAFVHACVRAPHATRARARAACHTQIPRTHRAASRCAQARGHAWRMEGLTHALSGRSGRSQGAAHPKQPKKTTISADADVPHSRVILVYGWHLWLRESKQTHLAKAERGRSGASLKSARFSAPCGWPLTLAIAAQTSAFSASPRPS